MEIGIREAKNDLSRLIDAAVGGSEIIITRRGKPIVRLVPEIRTGGKSRGRGCLQDVAFPSGWDSRQLDAQIASLFEDDPPTTK